MGAPTVYVFGCFGRAGHFFQGHGPRLPYEQERPLAIWADGAARVGDLSEGHAHYRQDSRLGVSAVGWPDQQGDSRPGPHTEIIAFGQHTAEELLAMGRKQVPWAFRVEVNWTGWPEVTP